MTNFLSKYFSPSQITKIYMVLAVVAIMAITIIFSSMGETKKRVREKEAVTGVFIEENTREIGLDAVNQKVSVIQSGYSNLNKEMDGLKQENQEILQKTKSSEVLAKELGSAKKEISELKKQVAINKEEEKKRIKDAVEYTLKELNIYKEINGDNPYIDNQYESKAKPSKTKQPSAVDANGNSRPKTIPQVRRTESPQGTTDSVFSYSGGGRERVSTSKSSSFQEESRTSSLFQVIEGDEEVEEESEPELYLPMGSMLTGVLITGLDAPTDNEASDQPMPVLVRIKKEAVLPNYNYVDEVRECFALMAGYGDMSSERVYLRGEGISCVRKDGGVIETDFAGYVTGEDGKGGLKGTLVSRNGKVLANAMMAGFAEGMSSMFTTNTDPIIDSNGNISFGTNNAVSGLASGGATSMSKLSDYFMSIADATFPVIELGAGRVLTIIITKGTTL